MKHNNLKNEKLKEIMERAEFLISEVNEGDCPRNTQHMEGKGGNFIYEEILKNMKALETVSTVSTTEDDPKNLINEINEQFIVENIEKEIEKLLVSTMQKPHSYLHNLLLEMIASLEKIRLEQNEDDICFSLLSNAIYLVEILKEVDISIKEKLRKKCDNCSNKLN